jgi:hypothetical protein
MTPENFRAFVSKLHLIMNHSVDILYQPLERNRIRIVTIQPGEFDDDITISLSCVMFSEDKLPPYEALSYVWGSSSDGKRVNVAGVPNGSLDVTPNLYVALKYLRYGDKPRTMWIDAICINQKDDIEKGPQVALMGDIYRRADRVVVWLGPEANGSDRAMALIENTGRQVDFDWYTKELMPVPGAVDVTLGDPNAELPFGEVDLCAVYHLFCREWFERLWIRQEIALANSDAIIVCGTSVVRWQVFRLAWACIYIKRGKDFYFIDQLRSRLDDVEGILSQPRNVSLIRLRQYFSTAKCSDDRDRIYAVASLLGGKNDDDAFHIKPDYTKSVSQVYTDAALRSFRHCNNMILLQQCNFNADSKVPSWVPDWSVTTGNFEEQGLPHADGPFTAAPIFLDSGRLKVSAAHIGTIDKFRPLELALPVRLTRIATALLQLLSTIDLNADYMGLCSRLDAFVRTLCLDDFAELRDPPVPSSRSNFKASRQYLMELVSGKADPSDISTAAERFLTRVWNDLKYRCIFETAEGHIGLGTISAELGDQVIVIIGCDVPMLVRPLSDDNFKVVGACYTCGIGSGEALLGQLPDGIKRVLQLNKASGAWEPVFSNTTTGEVSRFDPRINEGFPYHTEFRQAFEANANVLLGMDDTLLKWLGTRGVDIKDYVFV